MAQKKAGGTALAEQFLGHTYPVHLDPEEDGGYVVALPDIGYGATQGDTLEEALRHAEDMLEEAILGMIAHNEDVPAPSPAEGRPVVRLPALTAAKLEVYRAMRQAGLDEAQLAQRLGWPPKKITRIFDGYSHGPPRAARSRARRARPSVRCDVGTSVIEQRRG